MPSNISFRKNMSTFSLMMTGITSIVGSWWLLVTQKISNVAGPAGILAWSITDDNFGKKWSVDCIFYFWNKHDMLFR